MWNSVVTIQEMRCNSSGRNYKFYDRRNTGTEEPESFRTLLVSKRDLYVCALMKIATL